MALLRNVLDATLSAWAAGPGQQLENNRLPPDDHRPWPVPAAPWVMAQTWEELAFLHWPVRASLIQRLLPRSLSPDVFDGSAWLGITPFRVSGLRLRGLPAVPGLSAFQELNVRTYVTVEDKPGVFFFSLDAAHGLAVMLARASYALPYFLASGSMRRAGARIHFTSRRNHPQAPAAEFEALYEPVGEAAPARTETLEWWLTERYCLYAVDGQGRLRRADVHHLPWPLQPAVVELRRNSMAAVVGLQLDARPALVHYAQGVDVNIWPLQPVGGASARATRRP